MLLLLLNYFYLARFSSNLYSKNVQEVVPKYTGIIFGAGLRKNGTPTRILADRLDAGAELYRLGKVKRLLLSGDNRQQNHDEPEAMKRYLLSKGVPAGDIFLDYAGFDTYSTVYRAKVVFQVKDAILISQKYHLDRALYLGKHMDMDVVGYASDKRTYRKAIYYSGREILSRAKAQFDLIRHRKPHFLGNPIDIEGASNAMAKESSTN